MVLFPGKFAFTFTLGTLFFMLSFAMLQVRLPVLCLRAARRLNYVD